MVEAQLEASLNQAYEHGFVTDVAEESLHRVWTNL